MEPINNIVEQERNLLAQQQGCNNAIAKSTQPSSSEHPQLTLWGNRAPATYWIEEIDGRPVPKGEVADCIRTLSIAFPSMSPDFWALLTKRFLALGFSRERLQYILKTAIDTEALIHQYRFGHLCIADFTSITKPLPIIPTQQAFRMKDEGRTDLVSIERGYKDYVVTTKEAAEFANLNYTPF